MTHYEIEEQERTVILFFGVLWNLSQRCLLLGPLCHVSIERATDALRVACSARNNNNRGNLSATSTYRNNRYLSVSWLDALLACSGWTVCFMLDVFFSGHISLLLRPWFAIAVVRHQWLTRFADLLLRSSCSVLPDPCPASRTSLLAISYDWRFVRQTETTRPLRQLITVNWNSSS